MSPQIHSDRMEGAIIEKNKNKNTGPRVRKRTSSSISLGQVTSLPTLSVFIHKMHTWLPAPTPVQFSLFLTTVLILKLPSGVAFYCVSDHVTPLFKALPIALGSDSSGDDSSLHSGFLPPLPPLLAKLLPTEVLHSRTSCP